MYILQEFSLYIICFKLHGVCIRIYVIKEINMDLLVLYSIFKTFRCFWEFVYIYTITISVDRYWFYLLNKSDIFTGSYFHTVKISKWYFFKNNKLLWRHVVYVINVINRIFNGLTLNMKLISLVRQDSWKY